MGEVCVAFLSSSNESQMDIIIIHSKDSSSRVDFHKCMKKTQQKDGSINAQAKEQRCHENGLIQTTVTCTGQAFNCQSNEDLG